jgi:hypothetical protein
MKKLLVLFAVVAVPWGGGCRSAQSSAAVSSSFVPHIVRLDTRFDQIVAKYSVLEKVAEGFDLGRRTSLH